MMKLAVESPSVAYREGPEGVARLARAIEDIGYDELDMFDHVVMGSPSRAARRVPNPASMPILEAFMTLAYVAAVTRRIRLGIGVGWQESEYEALGEEFQQPRTAEGRGDRAAAHVLEPALDRFHGQALPGPRDGHGAEAAARRRPANMDRRELRGRPPPRRQVRRRVARQPGDGSRVRPANHREHPATCPRGRPRPGRHRAPEHGGLATDDSAGKRFYADADQVVRRVVELRGMGFGWATINATAIFQPGACSVDRMIDALRLMRDKIRAAVGSGPPR